MVVLEIYVNMNIKSKNKTEITCTLSLSFLFSVRCKLTRKQKLLLHARDTKRNTEEEY